MDRSPYCVQCLGGIGSVGSTHERCEQADAHGCTTVCGENHWRAAAHDTSCALAASTATALRHSLADIITISVLWGKVGKKER